MRIKRLICWSIRLSVALSTDKTFAKFDKNKSVNGKLHSTSGMSDSFFTVPVSLFTNLEKFLIFIKIERDPKIAKNGKKRNESVEGMSREYKGRSLSDVTLWCERDFKCELDLLHNWHDMTCKYRNVWYYMRRHNIIYHNIIYDQIKWHSITK